MLVLKIRELVRQTCEAFEIQIIKGVVSHDPVHLLVSAPPNMAPSEIMRRIKGRSASNFVYKRKFQNFGCVLKTW